MAVVRKQRIRHKEDGQESKEEQEVGGSEPLDHLAYVFELTWLAMTIIHTRNMLPMIQKANSACQHWQIFLCCRNANVSMFGPSTSLLKTYVLHWLLMLGPAKSCIAVPMIPAMKRTRRMKERSIIVPGRSLRCAMKTISMIMKMMARVPTVTP